jgi:hypothetical protein
MEGKRNKGWAACVDNRNDIFREKHGMRKMVSIAVCLLMTLPLLAESKAVSIPFVTNSDGMVIVGATIGGNIPIHVIFDTGAGVDVFPPSLIEKVHGKPAGQFTGFRMTGERLDIPLFVIPELSVGPVTKKNVLVGSFDVLDQMHLEGIVSLNDFRQQPVTFDFPNKQVIFESKKSLAARRSTGSSAPLQVDDERGVILDIFSQFLLANQAGQCEIDTGSQSATVNMRYMAALGIDKDAKDVKKRERRTIAGATQVRYDTDLPGISLAAAAHVGLAPAHVSFSDIIYDCVVGVEFWAGRAFTVDISDRQIVVSNSAVSSSAPVP